MHRHIKIICRFQYVARLRKRFRNNRIQNNIGLCDGILGTYHTKFKFIPRKRKRRRTVAVGRILHKIRKRLYARFQHTAADAVRRFSRADQLRQHILQLLSQKDGDDGRRRLICAETVIISNIRRRFPEQIRMYVNGFEHTGQHQKELEVFMRRYAGFQKINPVVCRNRPVVVLARSVYARKRLFMQQTLQTMTSRHLLQCLHNELVMIRRHICGRINRSQLMLRRSNLIVLRFRGHA